MFVFFVFWDSYVIYMCVMDIINVLRTGMNISISHIRIHVWLCNIRKVGVESVEDG